MEHRIDADHAAYAALWARRGAVPETVGSLDLDQADATARPARALTEVSLDLEEALRLAAAASREYRTQREEAYLAALHLTAQRRAFETQYGLAGLATLDRSDTTGTATAGTEGTLSRALEAGGTFVAKLALDFVKTFAGDPVASTRALLTTDLTLPLARGSGTTVAREGLTQAEHDVLYGLRSFARFQQQLVVTVASGFYGVLEARDVVANEELTYASLQVVYERAQWIGKAGRLGDFQVDQAHQDVLRADDRRQQARQAYESALDDFKKTLGLPVAAHVTLREDSLERLRSRGLEAADTDTARVIATALARRLDLVTERDRLEDSRRHLAVAEDALGPDFSLLIHGGLDRGGERPLDLRTATGSGNVGLHVGLPLERTAERNAYREAEVNLERARRAVEETEDGVVADVRRAARTLDQARRSYDIQKDGVRLAERRVESAKIYLEASRATIRDVLDAENSLIEARNALTAALVSHAIARLDLERDSGTLDASILGHPVVPVATVTPVAPKAPMPTPPSPIATATPSTPTVAAPPTPAVAAPAEPPAPATATGPASTPR
jgi:outer membrane protein TolC